MSAMFHKGDKIKLINGSLGTIESVVKTDIKNIYKVIFTASGEEGYYEEDKIILVEKRMENKVWQTIRAIFHWN